MKHCIHCLHWMCINKSDRCYIWVSSLASIFNVKNWNCSLFSGRVSVGLLVAVHPKVGQFYCAINLCEKRSSCFSPFVESVRNAYNSSVMQYAGLCMILSDFLAVFFSYAMFSFQSRIYSTMNELAIYLRSYWNIWIHYFNEHICMCLCVCVFFDVCQDSGVFKWWPAGQIRPARIV